MQRVLGSPGGKHCKSLYEKFKCMAKTYFDVQKRFWREVNDIVDTDLSEIDLGNVDTWQV